MVRSSRRAGPRPDPGVVHIGLLGCGTVGGEVLRLLREHADLITHRTGRRLEVAKVAVARRDKPRRVPVPPDRLVDDGWAVVQDEGVDVVVEVMGGVEPAYTYIRRALALGRPVVTANKRLLGTHGPELLRLADTSGVGLYFEAAVGGAIPLIKPLRESLAADRIHAITGILNGTTNYILTRMSEEGWTFEHALAAAQEHGFAEADPDEDLDGHDAAAKLAILATVAFHAPVTAEQVYRDGIAAIGPREIAYARQLGYAVKLLAIAAERDGGLDCRVHPTLLPLTHPLATIRDERNAVLVTGAATGPILFSGPGAGGTPTAVVVLGDIIEAADGRGSGAWPVRDSTFLARPVLPIGDLVVPSCLFLEVVDRPGVFAKVAAVFGEEMVSLASIVQKSRGETADVVLMTHEAPDGAVQRVVSRLRAMDVVAAVGPVLRVQEQEPRPG
ncbi:MAG: homoserine dehydrogenase [Armatimonadetes bacterium]|nr:homoserine dehydrogenase [Armatimonadota bacterium]